jgi:hypothetical protein
MIKAITTGKTLTIKKILVFFDFLPKEKKNGKTSLKELRKNDNFLLLS